MKNYDELTNDLLKRRDLYVADQKRKRKKVMTVVTSLSCFCIVALLGFGVWQSGIFNTTPPINSGEQSLSRDYNHTNETAGESNGKQNLGEQITIHGNKDSSENNDPVDILWAINRVDNYVGASQLNFDTDEYYSESKTLTDITAYLGRDLSTLEAVMPQGFEFFGRYETDFFYKLNGELAYDSCVFGYKNDDQQITIMVSKIGVPYDCLYILNSQTLSEINGVEVTIGGIRKADNPEEFELVFADFSHEGLQYRVTVENVPYDGSKDSVIWLVGIVTELTK